jgi:preprotein translocase subunit YajC
LTEGSDVVLADSSSGGSQVSFYLLIIVIIAAMYFLMIRPQNKRRREQMQMQSQLSPGDEVQTIGGLYGTVVSVDADSVVIEPSPGVQLRFVRNAIARVVPALADEPEQIESDEDGEAEEADEVSDESRGTRGDAKG